ncbi:hypothetical protein [Pseudactinotalea suaedae]|jgi:hypothetical protein|nr:hypothetical protein [Pseudactinotalea suaedae]
MSTVATRTVAVLTSAFSTYAEARTAELAERRLDAVHAQGSLSLLRH